MNLADQIRRQVAEDSPRNMELYLRAADALDAASLLALDGACAAFVATIGKDWRELSDAEKADLRTGMRAALGARWMEERDEMALRFYAMPLGLAVQRRKSAHGRPHGHLPMPALQEP